MPIGQTFHRSFLERGKILILGFSSVCAVFSMAIHLKLGAAAEGVNITFSEAVCHPC